MAILAPECTRQHVSRRPSAKHPLRQRIDIIKEITPCLRVCAICVQSFRILAEREGFEPSRRFPAYTLSKRAPSATRPPLHAQHHMQIARFIGLGGPCARHGAGTIRLAPKTQGFAAHYSGRVSGRFRSVPPRLGHLWLRGPTPRYYVKHVLVWDTFKRYNAVMIGIGGSAGPLRSDC